MRSLLGRVAVLAIAATAAVTVALPPQPASASAGRHSRTATPVDWTYVDSKTPLTRYDNVAADAPVGAWRDAVTGYHRARSYFTYDLTWLHGRHIFEATVVGAETEVNDCSEDRHVELSETAPVAADTSWSHRPAELARIGEPTAAEGCPAQRVSWDLTDRLRAAVKSSADRLTLGLQVSEDYEGAVKFGRRFASDLKIEVVYNTPPETPKDLKVEASYDRTEPCATEAPGDYLRVSRYYGITLSARVRDPDLGRWGQITARFAVWPVDDPAARLVRENPYASGAYPVRVTVYGNELADARTYAWAVQAFDGSHESAWTPPCYFTVDNTAPVKPVVASVEYPTDEHPGTGGPGVPGTFTFRPNGSDDVVAYDYEVSLREQPDKRGRLAADGPGGTASLTVTPSAGGRQGIGVTAIDRAGNRSPLTGYGFWVRETRPSVHSSDYRDDPTGRVGKTSAFEFRSELTGVVGYEYQLNDDPPQKVEADPSGVTTVGITPTRGGENVLRVRSYDAEGAFSPAREYRFTVPTAPTVSSTDYPEWRSSGTPNTPGTFRFAPEMPNVVAYLYQFSGEDEKTVEAAADGTATITWTPLSPGDHPLNVRSRTADGTLSEERRYSVRVGQGAPVVTSDTYRESEWSGWPGKTGSFTFTPKMPGVVSYSYKFNDGDWQTVPAGTDGTATITWTPPGGEFYRLNVVSRAANGARSGATGYSFGVKTGAPNISSTDYPRYGEHGYPGKTGTFTLTATMPADEFRYRWNDGEWRTVPVGSDGTATVTYTPETDGMHDLEAYSTSADGLRSGDARYVFFVYSGAPAVSSDDYPEWQWSGAPGTAGSFSITPGMPGMVEYEYLLSGGVTGTVTADADGSAVITWTPAESNWYTLSVRGRTSDGYQTSWTYYSFGVNEAP